MSNWEEAMELEISSEVSSANQPVADSALLADAAHQQVVTRIVMALFLIGGVFDSHARVQEFVSYYEILTARPE